NINGFAWGNATLKKNILKGLCGYYGKAPRDAGGASVHIAGRFTTYLTTTQPPTHSGDRVIDAWLEANIRNNGTVGSPAIAYNANNYWQVVRDLPWKPWKWKVKGPEPWP
ncbi:MAG: hypothetical protein N2381_11255, partial [Armatimonadetes bacterium]|nr:hypothetical protein [Armatimonadota bacterium]